MHDYDVGVTGLSVPPASAVIQPYRPAVLVRNNGVHDALAVGSLRIYSPAGLLIFTSALYSGVIAPGETQPAQAVNYWTPPALGRYMFIATVSCLHDQFEPNDNLPPTFIDVIPGEPSPPSPVPLHAAQHEEGGSDEVNIDGLHGRATDAQTPLAHRDSHQVAGSDQLNVTGLPGILADGQPIADHHETHENHGTDELNVEGLFGVLANLQKPKVHANEAHDPNYSAKPHGNADHDPDFAELDEGGKVPATLLGGSDSTLKKFLRSDQTWRALSGSNALKSLEDPVRNPLTDYCLLQATIPAGITAGARTHVSMHGSAYWSNPKVITIYLCAADIDDPTWKQISDYATITDPAPGLCWYQFDAYIDLVHIGAPIKFSVLGFLDGFHQATGVGARITALVQTLFEFHPDSAKETKLGLFITTIDDGGYADGACITLESIGNIST